MNKQAATLLFLGLFVGLLTISGAIVWWLRNAGPQLAGQPEILKLQISPDQAAQYYVRECALRAGMVVSPIPSGYEEGANFYNYNVQLSACLIMTTAFYRGLDAGPDTPRILNRVWDVYQNKLLLDCYEARSGDVYCNTGGPKGGLSQGWLQRQISSFMGEMGGGGD
jgi:hypothetical protein